MRRPASHLLLLVVALLLGACRSRGSEGLVRRAEFGVLFGGQVQMLDEIPFELDRARQTLGFRLEFARALDATLPIVWELDMPCRATPSNARPSSRPGRTVRRGSTKAGVGRREFEQVLFFEPSDMLGTWNIRVRAGPIWVIDRPFLVYDAEARRLANRTDGGT
jgi:hypothetical protein